MSSIRLKQRSGSIKLKERTGSIELTNRKIIHKNYFGPDKAGYVTSDVQILHNYDRYDTVFKVDAAQNDGYEGFITNELNRSDFPNFGGNGKLLRMEFWAKWDEITYWGNNNTGVWTEKPAPDPNKYQKYVLESDGNNDRNEYFRLFYYPESKALAYITNVKVYKVSPPEYVFA